jgi:hypothetical protein
MASTGGGAPPIFADTAKFNGTNWVTWNGLICIAADLRSVFGYLDGTIHNPRPPSLPTATITPPSSPTAATTTTPIVEISWESTNPSATEWRVWNAWAKGLLIYNTTNPIGLGINIHGSAADAWKSYVDTYQVASEMALINAKQDLRNMTYADGDDFVEFLSKLHTKWSNATALGAKIDDSSFRMILLTALLQSWNPIVATLYTTQSSCDAINQLVTHWTRLN